MMTEGVNRKVKSMKDIMAQLSVNRSVLLDVLGLLTAHQRADLADRFSALVARLTDHWPSDTRSEFLQSQIDEYERILFRLGQMNKVGKSNEGGLQKAYFLCIKCNIPVIALDADTVCPGCGTVKWLELVHA